MGPPLLFSLDVDRSGSRISALDGLDLLSFSGNTLGLFDFFVVCPVWVLFIIFDLILDQDFLWALFDFSGKAVLIVLVCSFLSAISVSTCVTNFFIRLPVSTGGHKFSLCSVLDCNSDCSFLEEGCRSYQWFNSE